MSHTRIKHSGQVDYGELPELARAMRALGSSRRSGGERQSHFFLALLDARRRAEQATSPQARLDAFDAAELSRALDRVIERILGDWPDKRPSVRRALRAELGERVVPYSVALAALAERGREASEAPDPHRLEAWRGWTVQLAVTFEAADRAWLALMSVSDSLPQTTAP
ncbi:MAG: hypothetical protein AABZ80_02935 [Gemmatimonadota bacterium]